MTLNTHTKIGRIVLLQKTFEINMRYIRTEFRHTVCCGIHVEVNCSSFRPIAVVIRTYQVFIWIVLLVSDQSSWTRLFKSGPCGHLLGACFEMKKILNI
jgi:hypothetical protein